jgi:hypothetical protein
MPNERITHQQIAARAYQLWLEHGRPSGRDLDDWLQAEYELLQLPTEKIEEMNPPKQPKGEPKRKTLVDVVRQAAVLL